MKKLLFIAIIGTVACGESSTTVSTADSLKTTTVDTTTLPAEDIGKDTAIRNDTVSPVVDTTTRH